MCLIFAVLGQHPDLPVIIAANRDEFFDRPARPANFWEDYTDVLAGRDELAGGTWLGITRCGRFAAVTNFREPQPEAKPSSRGHIVSQWLQSCVEPADFGQQLLETGHHYAGFNCLYGALSNPAGLFYSSNRSPATKVLGKGVFGLSNSLLDSDWPKILTGKQQIRDLLAQDWSTAQWLEMLANRQPAPDHVLPDTGIGQEKERLLSPIFIRSPGYGTRCSTVITVSPAGDVSFTEKTYSASGETSLQEFTFRIKP